MLPGPALIVNCPHCNGEKKLLSLLSGNTFNGRQWWDLKKDYPMMPRLSYVQKCPHCGKYFMLAEAQHREGDDDSFEKGMLSYQELREAWAQMRDNLREDLRVSFFLEYLWAFNDAFQREDPALEKFDGKILWTKLKNSPGKEVRIPTEEEWAELAGIVRELVASFPVENKVIHAEFLREARLFDEALAILEQQQEPNEGPYKILEDIIRGGCHMKYSRVGLVVFPNE